MLKLTRRIGETLHIGNDITVTVIKVEGNQTRLAIDAPRDVSVRREETIIASETEASDLGAVEARNHG